MLVLIVEDNAFNAFCLSRILGNTIKTSQVRIAVNSVEAFDMIAADSFDLIVLDGDLSAGDGLQCNGPALLDILWSENPTYNVVAWTDSVTLRQGFAEVFARHNKAFNAHSYWPKMVSEKQIRGFVRHCFPNQNCSSVPVNEHTERQRN